MEAQLDQDQAHRAVLWVKDSLRSDTDGDKRLGIFTVSLIGLGLGVLGIDMAVTSRALYSDENGYPVRLIIPEILVEEAKRPPPMLLGENAELVSAALAQRAEAREAANPSGSVGPSSFDMAFANGAFGTVPTRAAATAPQIGRAGMMEVDFDLEGGADSSSAISVNKPVAVGGASGGKLAIRIDGAAQIFADRGQVAALIDGTDAKTAEKVRTASGEDYLSFQKLRDLGVNIRYDPAADQIVIPTDG